MSNPIPFPGADRIPILGQPCTVHGWFPTVHLTCNCEAKSPLLIVGLGSIAECPACHKAFAITELSHNHQTGEGRVGVGTVIVNKGNASAPAS